MCAQSCTKLRVEGRRDPEGRDAGHRIGGTWTPRPGPELGGHAPAQPRDREPCRLPLAIVLESPASLAHGAAAHRSTVLA
jgi:hypothetical protein